MKRILAASFALGSALHLVGCGGIGVNQDGRYASANRTLEQVGRVRTTFPFVTTQAKKDSSRLPPPLPYFDGYLKLWVVSIGGPFASTRESQENSFSGYNYYEDQRLTKYAGKAIYQQESFGGNLRTTTIEEFLKGTRAGQKVNRTVNFDNFGGHESEFEIEDSTVPDTHKGTESYSGMKFESKYSLVSTVKGITVQTTALIDGLGINPKSMRFRGTFSLSTGASVSWEDSIGSGGTFTMTGTGVAFPAKGSYDATGNGTLTYADGVTQTFKFDSKGVKF
jgi:hypothetical protein